MKLSIKVAALLLAGSLTTVFAANTVNTDAMTKESIIAKVQEIKVASDEQKVELMNQFKIQLQTQDSATRQEAMEIYAQEMGINPQIDTQSMDTTKIQTQNNAMNQNKMMIQNQTGGHNTNNTMSTQNNSSFMNH